MPNLPRRSCSHACQGRRRCGRQGHEFDKARRRCGATSTASLRFPGWVVQPTAIGSTAGPEADPASLERRNPRRIKRLEGGHLRVDREEAPSERSVISLRSRKDQRNAIKRRAVRERKADPAESSGRRVVAVARSGTGPRSARPPPQRPRRSPWRPGTGKQSSFAHDRANAPGSRRAWIHSLRAPSRCRGHVARKHGPDRAPHRQRLNPNNRHRRRHGCAAHQWRSSRTNKRRSRGQPNSAANCTSFQPGAMRSTHNATHHYARKPK